MQPLARDLTTFNKPPWHALERGTVVASRVVASFLAARRQFWHVGTVVNSEEGDINDAARDKS